MTLHETETLTYTLGAGDAYVIPPGLETMMSDCSADLELLEVAMPGEFEVTQRPHSGSNR